MPGSNGTPISPSQIQELREASGAGIMDCKKALEESDGNMEKAKAWLKDRGVAIAAQKGGRMAKEGLIGSYIHAGGKLGVLVELISKTFSKKFVSRSPPRARVGSPAMSSPLRSWKKNAKSSKKKL